MDKDTISKNWKESILKITTTSPYIDKEDKEAIKKIVETGWFSQGTESFKFEEEFASFMEKKYAIAVSSGSAAILLMLDTLLQMGKLKPGDEIVTPALSYITTVSSIFRLGLKPIFVDVILDPTSPHYLTMDYNKTAKGLGKAKAILPVHFLGNTASRDLVNLSKTIIEDACNITRIDGRGYGMAQGWSFFPAHHMTTGEGGMITTDDKDFASICRSLREYGRLCYVVCKFPRCPQVLNPEYLCPNVDNRLKFKYLGWNLKMTNLSAALGRSQLKKVPFFLQRRQENAKLMIDKLKKYRTYGVIIPEFSSSNDWFAFPIVLERGIEKKTLEQFLRKNGIETRALLGGNIINQPALKGQKFRIAGDLGNARYIDKHSFMIGIHPGVTKKDICFMESTFEKYFEKEGRIFNK